MESQNEADTRRTLLRDSCLNPFLLLNITTNILTTVLNKHIHPHTASGSIVDTGVSKDTQELQKDVATLSAEVADLEDQLAAAKEAIETMKREAAEKEHRLYVSANASINKVFSAIPVRCASLESGRIVIHTHDESGRSLAKLSTAEEIEETQRQLIAPNVMSALSTSGSSEKKRLFGSRRPVSPGPAQQQQHRGSGSTVRVFRLDDTSNAGTVCVAVRFRMDYGTTAPRVTVMTQTYGVNEVSNVLGKDIKATAAGFAFELKKNDLGSAHNMVVNWIAVTDPPKNPALQTLLETILAQNSGGGGGAGDSATSNAELDKAVSKFVHANGTEAADTNGQTLLHASASAGNERLVRYLLGKGARLNAVDEHGWTALLCAVSAGHLGLALELLDSGADGTVVTESGSNCLHYLARWPRKQTTEKTGAEEAEGNSRYDKLLRRLLDIGCDPNGYNNDGDTPVNVFCQRGAIPDVVRQLLEKGGSVSVANQRGFSPLHAAVANDSVDLVRLLCKHGADPNFVANVDVDSPYTMALKEGKKQIEAIFDEVQGTNSGSSKAHSSVMGSAFDIRIVEARELPRVENVCAVVHYESSSKIDLRTEYAAQTQNPVWNRTFKLDRVPDNKVTVEVMWLNTAGVTASFGKALLDLGQTGLSSTDFWLPLSEDGKAEAAGSGAAHSSGRLHVTVTRIGGVALASDNVHPFVSWSFPREQWTSHASNSRAEWCIDSCCLKKGFLLETSLGDTTHTKPLPSVFNHHASDYRFREYFTEQDDVVYGTVDGQPVVVSIQEGHQPEEFVKAIIRTRKEDVACIVPFAKNSVATVKSPALTTYLPQMREGVRWKACHGPNVYRALLHFEDRTVVTSTRYKFGLMYAGPNQSQESEIFDNRAMSGEFLDFCKMLGDIVTLQGFTGYRGGLDVKNNNTGMTSVYTTIGGGQKPVEVMFHVAPMLPFQPDDPQRIERKRHIGNDVCVLIYKDSTGPDDTVDITSFLSHFINIFIVVSPAFDLPPGSPPLYRVAVCCKSSNIKPFPPYLSPRNNLFEKGGALREWLLQKCLCFPFPSLFSSVLCSLFLC